MAKRGSAVLSVLGVLVVLGFALPGAAEDREFSGKVVSLSGDTLRVDNRGHQVSFVRSPKTVVQGAKKSWGAIAADDWVTISWDMMDAPQKVAHKVVVMRPKKD